MTTLSSRRIIGSVALALIGAAVLFSGMLARTHAQVSGRVTISQQLDVGSRGQDVRTLQTFLATNGSVYPQGIISGYYGPLTAAAVRNFQIGYELPPVGRVGPLTLALLNQMITNGTPIDVNAPIVSSLRVAPSRTEAVVTWQTSETSYGSVHYDSMPIVIREISTAHEGPATSGSLVADSALGVQHSVTLTGLIPGRAYYLSTESRDLAGNSAVTLSQTFTTAS